VSHAAGSAPASSSTRSNPTYNKVKSLVELKLIECIVVTSAQSEKDRPYILEGDICSHTLSTPPTQACEQVNSRTHVPQNLPAQFLYVPIRYRFQVSLFKPSVKALNPLISLIGTMSSAIDL
jgi:hypothetical protein